MKKFVIFVFILFLLLSSSLVEAQKEGIVVSTAEPTPIGIFDSPIDVVEPIFDSPVATPEPTPYTPPTDWELWDYPVDLLRWSK